MNIGDKIEIKEFDGGAWLWRNPQRIGHITAVDRRCYSVRTDDGEDIRDVHDHFRILAGDSEHKLS